MPPCVTSRIATLRTAWLGGLAALLTGCDPLLTIQGSFWPPWIVSMMLGLALTGAVTSLLNWLKLAPHLGPPLLIYPCLWAWMTFSTWLLGYG
jgi:hypothetical protein